MHTDLEDVLVVYRKLVKLIVILESIIISSLKLRDGVIKTILNRITKVDFMTNSKCLNFPSSASF